MPGISRTPTTKPQSSNSGYAESTLFVINHALAAVDLVRSRIATKTPERLLRVEEGTERIVESAKPKVMGVGMLALEAAKRNSSNSHHAVGAAVGTVAIITVAYAAKYFYSLYKDLQPLSKNSQIEENPY